MNPITLSIVRAGRSAAVYISIQETIPSHLLSEAIRSKFNIHGERISYPDVVEWCLLQEHDNPYDA